VVTPTPLTWSTGTNGRWHATTSDDQLAGTVEHGDRFDLLDDTNEFVGYFDTLEQAQSALEQHVQRQEQRARNRRAALIVVGVAGIAATIGATLILAVDEML